MFQDVRHAARMLLQNKSWTAVVLLSLALGIGANATLFTGVNGLLLRTVGVPHPEQLVRLRYAGKNDMRRSFNGYGYNEKNAEGGTSANPFPILFMKRCAWPTRP